MKAWIFLAIKDLSKRRRETLMVILAITIGVVGPLFTTALNNGMQNAFVGNTVDVYIGHLQIQPDTGEDFIPRSESVVSKVTGIKGIQGVAPRIIGGVAIESNTERIGIAMYGIRPSLEEKASTLSKTVERGEFLDDKDKYELLIGTSLSEMLKVDVGDTVLIQYMDRQPVRFRIKGIISTGTWELDRYGIISTYNTVKQLIEKDDATSILVRLERPDDSIMYRTIIQKETAHPNVKTWQELSAGMAGMIETFGAISLLTSAISVLVAAIAISLIIYTTVKNKIRQIGVLKAIGARGSMILKIYLVEALFIGVIGTVLGTIIGMFLISGMQQNPLIMEPEYGMKLVITPWISIRSIIAADLAILLTCILGGIYPAFMAAKTNIIKAIWSG
ncbi:ABC-type transport system, involved in lipoprotein release, permease component [Candidatus Methanoperedens nitroreducens]|uniref:ABC-type transport system, involved in lipoprotein release, permease component n=1 Tax=Candidatus Methanoperedens nitratireducens TaxID=1392998 RepID=A0A062V902_9EURY|nr:FtsX-like permease family protein [Candidatus Methanoperedens nitroreducens]KCZ72998.1 ABC-type transport system, involved in lipoprotein release, permease component [Candidatus Methanoperedens nitroreducens]MDJ1423058.1 ABC transporter permease [Candidatus Methanoperedens sp.]